MGRIAAGVIVLAGVLMAIAVYYTQLYAFYDETPVVDEIALMSVVSGAPEILPVDGFQGIDATSSPLRYRACFTTDLSVATLTETYVLAEDATPLTGPGWFECYDAEAAGAALAEGTALAFVGTENIVYGIDRIVAIFDDGRGMVWHQINVCGEEVFDGRPAPEGCPPKPEGAN